MSENLPSSTSTTATLRTHRVHSLQHGYLLANNENRRSTPYVLVPMGWNRDTDEEYVSEIFNALKIPLPPVVFITSKSNPANENITKDRTAMLFPKLGLRRKPSRTESTATVPNRQDSSVEGSDHDVLQLFDLIKEDPTEEEIKLFHTISESKLLSIMKAISNTFAQCNAIYLAKHNSKYREFDEMVGKSLPENGVQLVPVVLNKDQVTIFRQNSVPISDEVMHGIPGFRDEYSSGVTHFLCFEDEEDGTHFDRIVERVLSVGVFCVAGDSFMVARQSAEFLSKGLPMFVFKHTIASAHMMSSLLEYHNDMCTADDVRKVVSIEDRMSPASVYSFGKSDTYLRIAQQIAYNWPQNYNEDAVLLVNHLSDKPQDLIYKILNLFASVHASVNTSELGWAGAEDMAIAQANHMLKQLSKLSANYKLMAYILYTVIVFLGFIITVISVVSTDSNIHVSSYPPNMTQQLASTNTALPIILGIFMTIYSSISPETSWASFSYAKARIECELFKYRCRVGPYKRRVGVNGAINSRSVFTDALRDIWNDISQLNVVENGALDAEDIKYLTQQTQSGSSASPPHPEPRAASNSVVRQSELTNLNMKFNELIRGKANMAPGSEAEDIAAKMREVDKAKKAKFGLTAEDYIRDRIFPLLVEMEASIPRLTLINRILQAAIIIVSSVGAIFAANNQQIWIPILFAFAAMLQAYLKFQELTLRIQRANSTFAFLRKTLLWWTGLSLIEKRVPAYKERLVVDVEDLILADVGALTRAQITHTRKSDETEADTDQSAADSQKSTKLDGGRKQGANAASPMSSKASSKTMAL